MIPLRSNRLMPTATLTKGSPVLTFHCELDLALTYALRRPRLAIQCAIRALQAAIESKRPDAMYRANEVLAALGGAL